MHGNSATSTHRNISNFNSHVLLALAVLVAVLLAPQLVAAKPRFIQEASNNELTARTGSGSSSSSNSNSGALNINDALSKFHFNAGSTRDRANSDKEDAKDGSDGSHTGPEDTQNLADIALVIGVDGAIHAVKRDSGLWVWSVHDDNEQSQRQEILRNPLVKSQARSALNRSTSANDDSPARPTVDSDSEEDEIYIIEPHSAGDIYVYHRSSGKVNKLPLSITQLVELSPFSFPNDPSNSNLSSNNDGKLFVGKKETRLVGVDLASGKLVGVFGPEVGWCDWLRPPTSPSLNATLGSIPDGDAIENRPSDLLYLGRTDYHISIYSKTQGLLQTLSYTSYGPSSLKATSSGSPPSTSNSDTNDHAFTNSPDGRYIQPMVDGRLVCFSGDSGGQLVWANQFSQPIIAVYDIVYPISSGTSTGMPSLDQDAQRQQQNRGQPNLVPHPHITSTLHHEFMAIQNLGPTTFIGQIPTGSDNSDGPQYFAMANWRYPLVIFAKPAIEGNSESNAESREGRLLGSHKIEQPIHSGKTIDPRPERLGIDPVPSQPNQDTPTVPSGERSPSHKPLPTLPNQNTVQGTWDTLKNMALIGICFAIAYYYFSNRKPRNVQNNNIPASKKKGKSRRKALFDFGRKSNNQQEQEVLQTAEASESQAPSLVSSFSSENGSANQRTITSPILSNEKGLHIPGGFKRHAASPSIEKALPALPPPSPHLVPTSAGSNVVESPLDNGLLPPPILPDIKRVPSSSSSISEPRDGTAAVAHHPEAGPPPSQLPTEVNEGDSEDEGDNDMKDAPANRKKGRRRKRGKRPAAKNALQATNASPTDDQDDVQRIPTSSTHAVVDQDKDVAGKVGSLVVSDKIIGYGSHGTVVLKGTFQGRAVAVKRLLKDFVTVASHEVKLLQESDVHTNVIRYYCKEQHENFLYIALEECIASLYDVIDKPKDFASLTASFDSLKALKQITRGLRHLHKLKIIHRDLKPQNILIASATPLRLVISDFGLCKKLDLDESSFLQSVRGGGMNAPGSFGYRAPEVLRGEVDTNDLVNNDGEGSGSGEQTREAATNHSSNGGSTASTSTIAAKPASAEQTGRKLTRSIDIFSLGCIFFFVLTNGDHPFGSRYEREMNILNDKMFLDGLSVMTEVQYEADQLVRSMCHADPRLRPTASDILLDPLFWPAHTALQFLCDASDRFEIMDRESSSTISELEYVAEDIVGKDWLKNSLDRNLVDNLGKYRKYDAGSVRDLLRVIRNKRNHYQDLPENVRRSLGEPPGAFLTYFTRRFPKLLLHVHSIVRTHLSHEAMFARYFEQHDDG